MVCQAGALALELPSWGPSFLYRAGVGPRGALGCNLSSGPSEPSPRPLARVSFPIPELGAENPAVAWE